MSDRQHGTCVIDPALALSQYGVSLIKQLGGVMELWVVREFWHILNNSAFYLQQPELITPKVIGSERIPAQERTVLEKTFWALKEWEKFRMETDLAGLNLFWLGDSPRESLLPKRRSIEIFWRWESLASLLDNQLNQSQTADYILPMAFRDTIALAACLESAFILTYQLPTDSDKNSSPEICKALENWGVPCQVLAPQDSIVAMERDYLRQLFIHTGIGKLLWAGVRLTVLHILVPTIPKVHMLPEQLQTDSLPLMKNSIDDPKSHKNPWVEARGFWYLI